MPSNPANAPTYNSTHVATDAPAAEAGQIFLGGDLSVNRMGLGAMRITGPGIWGPPADHDEAIRVLRRAVELGVNFIDTANSYGPNVSEELIAEALHPYPADLVIATKGGFERTGPNRWVMNGRPDHLRRELDGSLRRLRLERIDLYQLHRIDPGVPAGEQFDVLTEFQREGKVRHVGLSEVSVGDIQSAQQVVPIVSVQNEYNANDRKSDPVLDYCTKEAMAFIPWSPLGAGTISKDNRVEEVARRRGITPLAVAIAWLLARSPAMLVIPGTSSVVHLEENVAAAALTLSSDDIAQLDDR